MIPRSHPKGSLVHILCDHMGRTDRHDGDPTRLDPAEATLSDAAGETWCQLMTPGHPRPMMVPRDEVWLTRPEAVEHLKLRLIQSQAKLKTQLASISAKLSRIDRLEQPGKGGPPHAIL